MPLTDEQLLQTPVTVPDHVVRRPFAEETIALNLRSATYHGINPTGALMLDGLEAGELPATVAARIAAAAGQPVELVETDLVRLLRTLAERGLVEFHDDVDVS